MRHHRRLHFGIFKFKLAKQATVLSLFEYVFGLPTSFQRHPVYHFCIIIETFINGSIFFSHKSFSLLHLQHKSLFKRVVTLWIRIFNGKNVNSSFKQRLSFLSKAVTNITYY